MRGTRSLALVAAAVLGIAGAAPGRAQSVATKAGAAAKTVSANLGTSGPAAVTPASVVAAAAEGEWTTIAPSDLLVMDLPPLPTAIDTAPANAEGEPPIAPPVVPPPAVPRRIVVQLIAPPYSQGWVSNIRTLAGAHWWDGLAIVRVQDNYVVQWGDPEGETPALARPLPEGLQRMPAADYLAGKPGGCGAFAQMCADPSLALFTSDEIRDSYADHAGFVGGFPVAVEGSRTWPVHCYGSVGIGRNVAPDTGTGAELYAVIGQAPRQLDRNIAVVGRVIEGIEHLSSLPRGTAELGFYATPEQRTPILSVRLGSEVPELPAYQYLSTTSASFARYVHARANRKDDFYIQPAGSVDVCNVPVPVRRAPLPPEPKKTRGKPSR